MNRLAKLDHDHVWHPFTPMQQWREQPPTIIERAEGDYLIDTQGKRYIDGSSSLWCNVHGHRVPQIDQAIRDQLDRVAHTTLLGLASPPSIELAARLVEMMPGAATAGAHKLNKVFYSDAGATALEAAFKMAVGYWFHTGHPDKTRFIALTGAYHGDTTGSMSVGYDEFFHRPFASMVFPTRFMPTPDMARSMFARDAAVAFPSQDAKLAEAVRDQCLAKLRAMLEEDAGRTAAIVLEPLMQGAAGMICQPPGFLKGVADLARQYDTLLIVDEVATGFGRTGTMFACEQEDVTPDIMCVAKGITGGYLPLAATITTDRVEQAFCGQISDQRTFYHGHTYTGNALGCAAALASLDLFQSTNLLSHIQQSTQIMAQRLGELAQSPHVLDVRQRGMMAGIELCRDRDSRQPLDYSTPAGGAVCALMREQGLMVRPLGDVVVLMPIPAMSHQTLGRMLDIVVSTIRNWRFE